MPLQKFGDPSVEQIEHLRCKHRIRVLQGHEEITKQNVVSAWGPMGAPPHGSRVEWAHMSRWPMGDFGEGVYGSDRACV